MNNTLRYISSVLLCLTGFGGLAQEGGSSAEPLTSGLRIGVDLGKYVYQIVEPRVTGFEMSLDYEIKPNYFITLEGGYEKATPQSEKYNYDLQGYYGRIGFDYDLLKNTEDLDILFVGLRYGLSRYTQSASNIETNSYWGNSQQNIPEDVVNAYWIEAVLGAKVELYFLKNVFLGWTIRGRVLVGGNDYLVLQPFTIPGYGNPENNLQLGATWSVYYNIPLKSK